jgi:hypothetical protein
MVIITRTVNEVALSAGLEWKAIDESSGRVVGYFFRECEAQVTATALNAIASGGYIVGGIEEKEHE